MPLDFNESAYLQAFLYGRENEEANRRRPFEALAELEQNSGKFADQQQKYAQLDEQNKTIAERYPELLSKNRISDKVSTGQGEAAISKGNRLGLVPGFERWKEGNFKPPQEETPISNIDRILQNPENLTMKDYGELAVIKKSFQPDQEQENYSLIGTNEAGFPVFADRGGRMKLGEFNIQPKSTNAPTGSGVTKPPAGYRYTNTGDLEPIPGGPADRKVSDASNKISTVYDLYKTARNGLLTALENSATGPIVGRTPAFTSDQQTAQGAVAAMAPVLKQLFRVAGEGVFTDRDQLLLMQMIPTREMRKEAINNQIKNIDAIVKAKLGIREGDELGVGTSNSGQGLDEAKRARLAELRAKRDAGKLRK